MSNQEVSGMRAAYSTLLREDGSTSCNCPGWIFKKKGEKIRWCKHTKQIEAEAKVLYKKWQKGEKLPPVEVASALSSMPSPTVHSSNIKYHRVIEL